MRTLRLRDASSARGLYEAFGHYNVNRQASPNGKDDMREAVALIHAAGLKAGLHTLTPVSIEGAWLKTDEIHQSLARIFTHWRRR